MIKFLSSICTKYLLIKIVESVLCLYFLLLLSFIQSGQKSVSVFSSNFSKMVKDTKMKFSQLKENRLTNYMIPNLWKGFNRTDDGIIISKNYVRLFYLHMCSKWAPPRSGHII